METNTNAQGTFLAIARAIRNSEGYDDWNVSFNQPVLRDVYRLAAAHLDEATCRAHDLPTLAALDEAEAQAQKAGHNTPQGTNDPLPEPWLKTTGEAL